MCTVVCVHEVGLGQRFEGLEPSKVYQPSKNKLSFAFVTIVTNYVLVNKFEQVLMYVCNIEEHAFIFKF